MLRAHRHALVLLGLALVIGAALRFYRLGASDLSADEGASWAAASLPTVRAVVQTEQRLDPGKLALYDLALHGWIAMFGDGLFAMRAMSAALGTAAIFLVFVSIREVLISLGDDSVTHSDGASGKPPDGGESSGPARAESGEASEDAVALATVTGAFAALLYATNLGMVLTDRTARMYSLVIAAALLQITFLVRTQRRGGVGNYAGVAIFTAAMVAANFTASFLLVAEASWLGCLLVAKLAGARAGGLAIFRPGFAVLAGLALLGPMIPGAIASSEAAVRYGAINWLRLHSISWPYTTLRGVAGEHSLFRIFVALGALGVWWNWRKVRLAAGFLCAWMLGPLATVMAVTYLIRPLEYPRYVIIVSVALFAFVALGAAIPRSTVGRAVTALLLIYLSLHPLFRHWEKHPGTAAWEQAAALAQRRAPPGSRIAVFPAFADNVVRYYLPPERRANVIGVHDDCGPARVLIMSGFALYSAARVAKLEACYPKRVASLHRVEVRSR